MTDDDFIKFVEQQASASEASRKRYSAFTSPYDGQSGFVGSFDEMQDSMNATEGGDHPCVFDRVEKAWDFPRGKTSQRKITRKDAVRFWLSARMISMSIWVLPDGFQKTSLRSSVNHHFDTLMIDAYRRAGVPTEVTIKVLDDERRELAAQIKAERKSK